VISLKFCSYEVLPYSKRKVKKKVDYMSKIKQTNIDKLEEKQLKLSSALRKNLQRRKAVGKTDKKQKDS